MKKTKVMKICTKCKQIKKLVNFYKNKSYKDNYSNWCKYCFQKYHKFYNKSYYLKNKDKINEYKKKYRKENKEVISIYNKKYKNRHKKEIKEYRIKNINILKRKQNKYETYKRKTDIKWKVSKNLRVRINIALKHSIKSLSTMFLIGCEIDYLMYCLQCKFKKGMNWNNYGYGKGKWVIDHIIPCANFDLSDPKQQKECFHYTNLQPLWWEENMRKGSKYEKFTLYF